MSHDKDFDDIRFSYAKMEKKNLTDLHILMGLITENSTSRPVMPLPVFTSG